MTKLTILQPSTCTNTTVFMSTLGSLARLSVLAQVATVALQLAPSARSRRKRPALLLHLYQVLRLLLQRRSIPQNAKPMRVVRWRESPCKVIVLWHSNIIILMIYSEPKVVPYYKVKGIDRNNPAYKEKVLYYLAKFREQEKMSTFNQELGQQGSGSGFANEKRQAKPHGAIPGY